MSATVVEELHRVWGGVRVDGLRELLTRFVDGLNEVAGYEAYALTMPDSESECAEISVA